MNTPPGRFAASLPCIGEGKKLSGLHFGHPSLMQGKGRGWGELGCCEAGEYVNG